MKLLNSKRCCFLLLFLVPFVPVLGNWNASFDEQTQNLSQLIPVFQSQDYKNHVDHFIRVRKQLLADASSTNEIRKAPPQNKLRLFYRPSSKSNEEIIIKKRRHNHIHDLYAWELSYLLGCSEFILPSFPIEIAEKRVILQFKESFKHGTKEGEYPGKLLQKVSLLNYWKSHLLAYILGLSDLAAGNIGIDEKGNIRFFDNEACLIYYNTPFKTEKSFSTGFISQSFDWPQYRQPVNEKIVKKLNAWIQSWANFEDLLKAYSSVRSISISQEGLSTRLSKVRSFDIHEGVAFRDFFGSIYPKLSPGLDELNSIVSKILNKKVDHGLSLYFLGRGILNAKLTQQQQRQIKDWVDRHVD